MVTPRFDLARAANIPSLNFWAPPGNSAGPLDVFDSKARFSNSMTWPLIGSTLRAYTIDQYRRGRTPICKEALTSWYFTMAASVSSSNWYIMPKKANACEWRGSISNTRLYWIFASSKRLRQHSQWSYIQVSLKVCSLQFSVTCPQIQICRWPWFLWALSNLSQIERFLKEGGSSLIAKETNYEPSRRGHKGNGYELSVVESHDPTFVNQ